jgi:hypothetical protein
MHTSNTTHDWNEPSLEAAEQRVWVDPNHVVSDPTMTIAEKRALLASWASDARAVPNYPPLRRLDSGAFVTIDAVLDALKRLDKLEGVELTDAVSPWPRKGHWSRLGQRWRRLSRDDDDDDPFSPAPAMRPPRLPVLDGAAAEAA